MIADVLVAGVVMLLALVGMATGPFTKPAPEWHSAAFGLSLLWAWAVLLEAGPWT